MSSLYPFCRTISLTASAVAALVLLTPASIAPLRAQVAAPTGQHAALSDGAKAPQTTTGATSGNVAAVDQANPQSQNPAQQKSLPGRALDKV